MTDYNFPPHIKTWMLSFLNERKQFIKIGDQISNVLPLCAGGPQGTRVGPNSFKVIINDLQFDETYVKYVDDVTVAAITKNPMDDGLQVTLQKIVDWCSYSKMNLNVCKTKDMVIHFGKKTDNERIKALFVGDEQIERVSSFKLLGIVFTNDLSWSAHVSFLVSRASKRIFVIYQLCRAGLGVMDILHVYIAIIRSILEYACPLWHFGLTKDQSEEIEGIQRRILKLVFPELSYSDALFCSGLERLDKRREAITCDLFKQIKAPTHPLNCLLHRKVLRGDGFKTRYDYEFQCPIFRTGRPMKSMLNYCIRKRL